MKTTRHILFTALAALCTLSLHSCFFSEDDVFDTPAMERSQQLRSHYQETLTSAPNGWLLEYYPGGKNHNIGGIALLMRFEGEDVTIMSDTESRAFNSDETINPGTAVTSQYKITADQSIVLSFCTYNTLIHAWSEPRGVLDVDGYSGDFEFVITGEDADGLTLRGKKHNAAMKLRRMPEGKDWSTYIQDCCRTRLASQDWGTLVGYQAGRKFAPSAYAQDNVIRLGQDEYDAQQSIVSFTYTDKGMRLYEPTTYGGVECYEFEWDNGEHAFYSTASHDVKLQYERPAYYLPIEYYTDHTWEMYYSYNFGQKDTMQVIRFSRTADTDTLVASVGVSTLKLPFKALYNKTTGKIEFRTHYVEQLVLTMTDGTNVAAYVHLCPWNDMSMNMYFIEEAGIVSRTLQMEPRILTFTDNGRVSDADNNGLVLFAFKGPSRSDERLGALETFNNITLKVQNP